MATIKAITANTPPRRNANTAMISKYTLKFSSMAGNGSFGMNRARMRDNPITKVMMTGTVLRQNMSCA